MTGRTLSPTRTAARPDVAPAPDAHRRRRPTLRLPLLWWRLTAVLSVVAGLSGIAAIVAAERVYSRETTLMVDVAGAQDLVTVLLIVPLTALLGLRARSGSAKALLCLPGCLAFLAYNSAIYAFSIQFGPLFLAWVAVLGLSVFALAGTLATTNMTEAQHFFGARPMRGTAWFLMIVAGLFAVLWLSEILPDVLAGAPSSSAADWQVPTNPVHVLDLAIFLPGVFLTGALLLRRHAAGYASVAGQLVWLALTSVPILVNPAVAAARGDAATWAVTVPIGVLLAAVLMVLAKALRRGDRPAGMHPPGLG